MLACIALAVGGWLIVLNHSGADTSVSGGPLRHQAPHAYFIYDRVGSVFADGFETLRLPGNEPAVITKVEVTGGSPALKYLGARVAGPTRKWGFEQRIYSFPQIPKRFGPTIPAAGAVIKPEAQLQTPIKSYELILGFRVISDEYSVRSSIDISYRVGDHSYLRSLPARLVSCGSSTPRSTCLSTFKDAYPHD